MKDKKELSWEEERELEKRRYLDDIDTSIKLLETLKTDYITPGTYGKINTSKVSRIRLTINDLLKKH